ncbi:MAG TPA: dynamin family protein [Urbifossiella sp.]|nr:dynamin family protein [Urbifossiella sp.]
MATPPDQLPPAFRTKVADAKGFFEQWEALEGPFHDLLGRSIGSADPARDAERERMATELRTAFDRLLNSLWKPTLVLATTGTTNSGKSALVNLICGAEIMPVLNQEMSAGVVTIRHGPSRTLIVHPTPGAVWECGTWADQSDADIRGRLKAVMLAYHEAVRSSSGRVAVPAFPRSELEYPTYVGGSPDVLGLPDGAGFRILDLPGLKYVEDHLNAAVIRESRDALCLVTYNSDESNERLQAQLLDQVVAQVKELGGSPVRMLFVLNRIDAVHRDLDRDEDWKPREDAFVERITGQIRDRLMTALPEYADEIQSLTMIRLSTQPALLAHLMRGTPGPDRTFAAARADGRYKDLIPKAARKGLPGDVDDYTDEQLARVANVLWETSYGAALFATLRRHVGRNLPELVIPPATDLFAAEAAGKVVEWLVQTAAAQLNASEEAYKKECARIQAVRGQLKDLCERCEREFQAPFQGIAPAVDKITQALDSRAADDVIARLQDDLRYDNLIRHDLFTSLARRGALKRNTLAALHTWMDEASSAGSDAFEGVAGILQSRADIPLVGLSQQHVHNLHVARGELLAAGYTPEMARAKTPTHLEERAGQYPGRTRKINEALNALTRRLAPLLGEVMSTVAKREMERVFATLDKLVGQYWAYVTEAARDIAPDVGLAVPTTTVARIDSGFTPTYRFQPGFNVVPVTRSEDTGQTKSVDTGKRRGWFSTIFYGRVVYEDKPVYEDRKYDTADVPGIEALLAGWIDQLKLQNLGLVRSFVVWLNEQIREASRVVARSQQELLDRYQAKLDEAHARAKQVRDETIGEWEPFLERARALQAALDRIRARPEKEGGA